MTRMALVAGLGALSLSCLAGLWLRRTFVIVTVRGGSMEPTLHNGDLVLVRRTSLRRVRRGQIIVFRLPAHARPKSPQPSHDPPTGAVGTGRSLDDRFMVKRAVAVPGDEVPGNLHPALSRQAGQPVPAGCLVAVGDNREASFDSRSYGFVTSELVLGIVLRPVGASARRASRTS
ncbi:signal peptidase I [Nonomuraea roseoviolacea subsp. roseoviolacea]|uniref:signal peptidase I n=1 Tax=Nonomuraea roseoviolacea TaxID=103837 RepID=UPI00338C9E06